LGYGFVVNLKKQKPMNRQIKNLRRREISKLEISANHSKEILAGKERRNLVVNDQSSGVHPNLSSTRPFIISVKAT